MKARRHHRKSQAASGVVISLDNGEWDEFESTLKMQSWLYTKAELQQAKLLISLCDWGT
jgi:hypothetical protein